jgi:hypothetical protein
MPSRPEELGEEALKGEGGAILIGSKGKLMYDTYGLNSRLLPKSLQDSVGTPAPKLPRITTSHEQNWADAAKGKGTASTPFEYAAQLTEVMLLGIVALRAGAKIHYDGANMRVTNIVRMGDKTIDPNDFLKRDYRPGFELR